MKIRDGHVSNSSSSSFVVVFPRKPKTVKDVLQFMFNGKEGTIDYEGWNDERLTHREVANRVFADMKKIKRASVSSVASEFEYRYHYSPADGCVFFLGGEKDPDGGRWDERRGRYCRSNKKAADKYKELEKEDQKRSKELNQKEWDLRDKFDKEYAKKHGSVPKHAYKGAKDHKTGKPYTAAEIKAYNAYLKAYDKFTDTDAEYKAYKEERSEFYGKHWKEQTEARQAMAESDAKNFLDDHKESFVFVIEYGDEDGDAVMEHGEIFSNVPYIRVSKH